MKSLTLYVGSIVLSSVLLGTGLWMARQESRSGLLAWKTRSHKEHEMVRKIRGHLMDRPLSIRAKNIGIQVQENEVTLRGWVSNSREHRAVVDFVKRISGGARVVDRLNVKS